MKKKSVKTAGKLASAVAVLNPPRAREQCPRCQVFSDSDNPQHEYPNGNKRYICTKCGCPFIVIPKMEKEINLANDQVFRHAVKYSDAVDYTERTLDKYEPTINPDMR